MYPRLLHNSLSQKNHGMSMLLFGPRQTGKSTLIQNLLANKKNSLIFRLNETQTYQELLKNPAFIFQSTQASLARHPKVNLFIDEIQLMPALLGDCQSLLDQNKDKLTIYLTGSSARKLRRDGSNLLPGRLIKKNLHALCFAEFMPIKESYLFPDMPQLCHSKTPHSLESLLIHGTLPGILTSSTDFKTEILQSYVSTYLQEEIRMEALARNLSQFTRFLELAALESGNSPNYAKLSNETGIPASTIQNYFEILEDTLIIFRVPPFAHPGRKKTLSTPRYYFYDTGIRNAAANLPLDSSLIKINLGTLFENFIVIELIRRIDYLAPKSWKYSFWRTTSGAEVDFIIETPDEIIPIEIKAATSPSKKHIRHLQTFIREYGCKRGYVVGQFSLPQKMTEEITAIPWWMV